MAPWCNTDGLESALNALADFAGTSAKELKKTYFLFGVALWYGDGMKLVVVEIDEDPSEKVELIELQLPGAWLGGDGHEFGGDDLNQINILDYLDDVSLPES